MKETGKDYRLELGGKLDIMGQVSNIPNVIRRYDRHIAYGNELANALDRYDDFATLRIAPSDYENRGGEYGIVRGSLHRGGDVILAHQQDSAGRLLRDLRGFGMLADVVGSGKTYEAGVVLSELAVRGKMRSLLLIVPEAILHDWKEVMEMRFGLGKDTLLRVGPDLFADEYKDELRIGEIAPGVPARPVIVSTEDFVHWDDTAAGVLFDVIVVDEAHRFSSEEGEYAKAMRLLSLMMRIKKKAERPYCLLLSATPHSGNLEKMFRLWYFIRCRGGNPDDFEEKEDAERTKEYRNEKEYYKNHVCNGAATVMEFVKRGRVSAVLTLPSLREKFHDYLVMNGLAANFFGNEITAGERDAVVRDFLARDPDPRHAMEDEVNRFVADAYHNGVLGSIMIRGGDNGVGKSKKVVNFFFFPASAAALSSGRVVAEEEGSRTEFELAGLYDPNCTAVHRTVYPGGGKRSGFVTTDMTLDEYAESKIAAPLVGDERALAVKRLRTMLLVQEVFGKGLGTGGDFDRKLFSKRGSLHYYDEQFQNCPDSVDNRIIPVPYPENATEEEARELSYRRKFAMARQLIMSHGNSRIIVFFDYSVRRDEALAERFAADIAADKEIKGRLLIGGEQGLKAVQDAFSEKRDAVLIVTSPRLTEGVNLQECNIIINFQVTADPVAMDQSIGRVFRIGQRNDVTIYSLADMEKLEGYSLAYFSRIGLMSTNSGDATIIAGSNSERMVAVRCKVCQRVALYSLEDYEKKRKDNSPDLWCRETSDCTAADPRGTYMEEISVYDFKCDTCGAMLSRSAEDEGYRCFSYGSTGALCNSWEKGVRTPYCNKVCALMHCSRFKPGGKLYDKCPVIRIYKEDRTANPTVLAAACKRCNRQDCWLECRFADGPESVAACTTCQYAECSPKPRAYEFDEKWETPCPRCAERGDRGVIRPIVARTFATYIRALWNFRHDGEGTAFCKHLLAESNNVAGIAKILAMRSKG